MKIVNCFIVALSLSCLAGSVGFAAEESANNETLMDASSPVGGSHGGNVAHNPDHGGGHGGGGGGYNPGHGGGGGGYNPGHGGGGGGYNPGHGGGGYYPGHGGGGYNPGHGFHPGYGGGHAYSPYPFHGGYNPWRHWDHPYFLRPVFGFEWNRLRSVTCSAQDSYGNEYPVTHTGYAGYVYRDRLDEVEDLAMDRCYQESGGDPSCTLLGCSPQY